MIPQTDTAPSMTLPCDIVNLALEAVLAYPTITGVHVVWERADRLLRYDSVRVTYHAIVGEKTYAATWQWSLDSLHNAQWPSTIVSEGCRHIVRDLLAKIAKARGV